MLEPKRKIHTLKSARVFAELKIWEVAKMSGLDKGTIGRYENGKTSPTMETLKKLSDIYGIPIDEIKV